MSLNCWQSYLRYRSESLDFWRIVVPVFIAAWSFGADAIAADPSTVEVGKKLVVDSKCEVCHASKLGGDGSSMYTRKDRRVTTLSKLQPQVARCNSELNLSLFPDDEAAIASYLNVKHYQFKE